MCIFVVICARVLRTSARMITSNVQNQPSDGRTSLAGKSLFENSKSRDVAFRLIVKHSMSIDLLFCLIAKHALDTKT